MKMAKASEADIRMAMDLVGILDNLGHRFCPSMPAEIAHDGDEYFDRDDDDQCGRALRVLLETAERGSLMRVVWGCAVMLDPRNALVDPNADTIERHPDTRTAAQLAAEVAAAVAEERAGYEYRLGAALLKAASDMPGGFDVQACVEKGAGWVTLHNEEGDVIDTDKDDECDMGREVLNAIDLAASIRTTGEAER